MKYTVYISLILLTLLLVLVPTPLFAQDGFVPLSQGGVPGIERDISFSDFLNIAFRIGLAIAVTLAVVMITIGGVQYMGRESVFGKTEGRERIQNAVVGLLIALLIWLILFTINPNLLNFNVNVSEPPQGGSGQNTPNNTGRGGAGLSN